MKKLYKTAIILTIIAVLLIAILNSCVRLKSYEYQPVVSYESHEIDIAEIAEGKQITEDNAIGVFDSILRYETVILISSIILVIVFTIIFFNINPRKK